MSTYFIFWFTENTLNNFLCDYIKNNSIFYKFKKDFIFWCGSGVIKMEDSDLIKFIHESMDELDNALVNKFLEIVEGKSKHSEIDQRRYIIIAFYATLPEHMPTALTVDAIINDEEWNQKPLEDMINYYAPSIVFNYKGMNKIPKNYSFP